MSAYVKSIIGEAGQGKLSQGKLVYSLSVGFVPWNFVIWPMQIFFAIVAVIVLAELGLSSREIALGAYLAQALLTAAATYWMLNVASSIYGL